MWSMDRLISGFWCRAEVSVLPKDFRVLPEGDIGNAILLCCTTLPVPQGM